MLNAAGGELKMDWTEHEHVQRNRAPVSVFNTQANPATLPRPGDCGREVGFS